MNEIKQQLKMKIGDTTNYQRNVVRKIHENYPTHVKKKAFFPVAVSLVLLVATCLFAFTFKGEEQYTTTLDAVPTHVVDEAENAVDPSEVRTPLTEEQKHRYYAQYVEIVENATEKKIGMGLEVAPMHTFQESDWVEPQEFESRVQSHVEGFLERERERLAVVTPYLKPAVMNPDGTTTKAQYLYFSDIVKKIEVTATFETQYDREKKRQLFNGIDNISAEMVNVQATWEQTFVQAMLLDGGRTYQIYMEGILHYNGLETEKAFTIEFLCDENGNIS